MHVPLFSAPKTTGSLRFCDNLIIYSTRCLQRFYLALLTLWVESKSKKTKHWVCFAMCLLTFKEFPKFNTSRKISHFQSADKKHKQTNKQQRSKVMLNIFHLNAKTLGLFIQLVSKVIKPPRNGLLINSTSGT